MTIDTKSRHRTKAGGNVFLDLGCSPQEAKGLLAQADAQIDESIRLKRQLLVGMLARIGKQVRLAVH